MNKILVGLIVGAVLGFVDGATAWFTPQVRDQMLGIVIGSTGKGIIAGIAAGWFARRVQSVPKGIAFGFVVGLLLAFAVAAMPDPKTGEHYWWQIMVPGSILGGVIGWATQRYGRPAARAAMAPALVIALAVLGVNVHAGEHDHPTVAAIPAFERLKGLAGTWDARTMTPDGEKTTVEYRVTGGGSTVMETMFAGSPHEMINMYTVDGDTVRAQHYCSAGNQPLLRLSSDKSTGDTLVFDFVSVTGSNLEHHINGLTLRFTPDGKVVEEWTSLGAKDRLTLYVNDRR
jgi:hypothetical protein